MAKHNGHSQTAQTENTIEDKLEALTDSVKGFVSNGTERVDAFKTKVVDLKDDAVTRGNALLDGATDYIQANPFKAVAIAFGVGYFAMRIFRR